MTLGELIAMLESYPPEQVRDIAFDRPHSWRGFYPDLAFEPAEKRTVGQMLADARSALGATYEGYKGGDYTMNEYSEVHIEHYGEADDLLPEYGMRWILSQ